VPPVDNATRAPALFLLAHHDDEVFCAGHLAHVLREGRPVWLLWATAGGLAPARRRIAEGERVRRLLALPETQAQSLSLPDQEALLHLPEIEREAERLLALMRADTAASTDAAERLELYVPAYEGGHPDHDAVNLVAAQLRARHDHVSVIEFPLYRRRAAWVTVQSGTPASGATPNHAALWLDDEALALRRRLALANASQLLVSLAPLLVLAAWAGRGRAEPARPLPAHAYTLPPAPRPLLYELYTRRRFSSFRAAAAAYLSP